MEPDADCPSVMKIVEFSPLCAVRKMVFAVLKLGDLKGNFLGSFLGLFLDYIKFFSQFFIIYNLVFKLSGKWLVFMQKNQQQPTSLH